MANTYTLIASNTLSSSAASVTFSSIPNTYTDLVLRLSTRTDVAGQAIKSITLTFNSIGGTAYSSTRLQGDGSSAASGRVSNAASLVLHFASEGATATSNTFSNNEIYIPSYTISANKPISSITAQENNQTNAYVVAHAGLLSDTAVISSITLSVSTDNFVSGSSFYLYGLYNS
jgi:hypothetical protein